MFKNKLFIFGNEELVQKKLNNHLLVFIIITVIIQGTVFVQGFHNKITKLFLQAVNWYYKNNFIAFLDYKNNWYFIFPLQKQKKSGKKKN